jgi:hypothetical protein
MHLLSRKLLLVVTLLAGGTVSMFAQNPLFEVRPFLAVGAATSTTLTGTAPTSPTTPRCSLVKTGPITGFGLAWNAQYTLVLTGWNQPGCGKKASSDVSASSGQLTITQNNGTFVMDVAMGDFNADGAVLSGTYSTPSYNITDPTVTATTAVTPNTGKFLNASGSGAIVFASGSSANAPAGSNPTLSTITLNGSLNGAK